MFGRRLLIPLVPLLCISVGPALATPGAKTPRALRHGKLSQSPLAGLAYHPEHVLVKFRPDVPKAHAEQAIAAAGHTRLRTYRRIGVHLLRVGPGKSVEQTVAELSRSPAVLYAEPDYVGRVKDTFPNDTSFSTQWALHNTGQSGGTSDADIDAPEAWQTRTLATDIVVAVIDTGVDYTHEDLDCGNIWTNVGETPDDDIDNDGNGYVDDYCGYDFCSIQAGGQDDDPFDEMGHGTHVSGTIGACTDNSTGVAGICWSVKIMSLKWMDSFGWGIASDAIEAIEYATMMGAHLSNNSWGLEEFSSALWDAISDANDAGVLFVAAAGNLALDNDVVPDVPSSFDLPNLISVAATDRYDDLASFSHWGMSSVDLGAPGVSILSTLPGDTYQAWDGTSMAAPHVAGAAALVWATNPAMTHLCVKARVLGTVDPLPSLDGMVLTGGRLNLNNALLCDSEFLTVFPAPGPGFIPGTWAAYDGEAAVITAYVTDCCTTSGATVTASFDNGNPDVALLDDGVAPDTYAGDSVYSGEWVPGGRAAVDVTITADQAAHTSGVANFSAHIIVPMYTYDDTATYSWETIPPGPPLMIPCDECWAQIPESFQFTFYGVTYTEFWVSDNGGILLEDAWLLWVNDALPTPNANALIAPLWDDYWEPEIYYDVKGTAPDRRLVIEWRDAEHYDVDWTGDYVTFQAILYESTGEIKFQYQDTSFGYAPYDNGASATVGIQENSVQGLCYSWNQPAIADGLAILFTPIPFPPPQVLLELHPNEQAPGVAGPDVGDPYWTAPGAGSTGVYTWKTYDFAGGANLWIQVCAQAQRASETPSGIQDRLQMRVDGVILSDYWADNMAAPLNWQWNGNFTLDMGRRKTLRFLSMGVPGVHTIRFKAVQYPIIWWIKVTDLELGVIEPPG